MSTKVSHTFVHGVGQFVPVLGQTFVWGPVLATHQIGDIFVVVYEKTWAEGDPETMFHTYIDRDGMWSDTNHSWPTLHRAILHGLAWAGTNEPNSARWNTYAAARVLELKEES